MTAVTDFTADFIPGARIKVIWVGGAGNNALNRMIKEHLQWVEFVAVNTDAQALANNLAPKKINVGINLTKWLGAWANPDNGRKAAEESVDEIKAVLYDTDMLFITCGMGWGTGTGAAPVIGQIAREMGILTIWVVTKPFGFEWNSRFNNAYEGIEKMKASVDALIVIPNDKIFNIVDKKTTFNQAFLLIDKILLLGVQGIAELITRPGLINIDFADIKTIMANSGTASLGIGYADGENRAVEAARQAIENPLLESRLSGAKKIIFAVTGGNNLTPIEVQEASKIVEEIADPDANIIWWMTIDDDYNDDEVKVTIIATGFQSEQETALTKPTQRDLLGRRIDPNTNFKASKSSSFFDRALKESEAADKPQSPVQPQEDTETPAFLRRKVR